MEPRLLLMRGSHSPTFEIRLCSSTSIEFSQELVSGGKGIAVRTA
jgi:hypothetical protein